MDTDRKEMRDVEISFKDHIDIHAQITREGDENAKDGSDTR